MTELLSANLFFCVLLTLSAFEVGRILQAKWKSPILNPILVGAVLVGIVLVALDFDVDVYQAGCAPLQYLLTPATICYSIGLYEQIGKLKQHLPAILAGVAAGTVASLCSIRLMAGLFQWDAVLTVSMLPKSVTTAIGMALSQEAGGIAALSTAAIILTGILGNMFGPTFCKLMGIREEIAQGVAYGTASHAVGTTKAAELSQLMGAVSSLSLTLAGLITVVLFSFLVP